MSLKDRCFEKLKVLGPGIITGASGDDPSGIATYSQTGAQFGLSMTWTMLFSYPLICAVQMMSARLGRVTGEGLAGNLRRHYSPRFVLYPVVTLLIGANIVNLGADIGAMAAGLNLLIKGPVLAYCLLFAIGSCAAQVWIPYTKYVQFLKWLCLTLFAYVASAFVVKIHWGAVAHATFIPHLKFDAESLKIFIAILGTTISPYLFFWQAEQEVEEMECSSDRKPLKKKPSQAEKAFSRIRTDTFTGMGISNLIAIFIIIVTASTLHEKGITHIDTAAQAAQALEPIAGKFAFFLFSMGIIGTGLLAVPVLAGSAAYAIGEARQWSVGLEREPKDAKAFYSVIVIGTLLGFVMNAINLDPIKALIWTAIINGVVAVPMIVLMIHMSKNQEVIGKYVISRPVHVLAWVAAVVMGLGVVGMIFL